MVSKIIMNVKLDTISLIKANKYLNFEVIYKNKIDGRKNNRASDFLQCNKEQNQVN